MLAMILEHVRVSAYFCCGPYTLQMAPKPLAENSLAQYKLGRNGARLIASVLHTLGRGAFPPGLRKNTADCRIRESLGA